MENVVIKLGGMSCGGCVRNVTQVLTQLPGVAAAQVSLEAGEARVEFDPGQVSLAALREAVEGAGFDAA
ncbi:MAG: heavy-metal-associated domain-containing protein [Zoogloeaceae bacterium]|nr:heavy-metal-associated domain-containing protein [Zoogloeaceae bacterium]